MPRKRKRRMNFKVDLNKRDLLTIAVFAIVFFSVAVRNLGLSQAPVNGWRTTETRTFYVDLGEQANAGTVYLLVKNGRHIPAWYLFDITGWNGVCGIEGTGFWEGIKGSISHVAIYGEEGVIPEPTMLLVWSGLAGMALQVRRRRV